MKRTMTITLLVFALVISSSVPVVFAAEQESQNKQDKSIEKNWQQALKTQVALAKTRVAMLEARSELWLSNNRETSLRSLEKAGNYLKKAYQSADVITQKRVADLRKDIETSKNAVRKKGKKAISQLTDLSNKSEAALNAAVAETQVRASDMKKYTITHLALVRAKASALEAKIALELEKSPEKAGRAMAGVEKYLAYAKASASQHTARKISELENAARVTRKAISGNVREAVRKLDNLITHIEDQLQEYGTSAKENKEANLLRKRFAQLEAQAALLKAQLDAWSKATIDESRAYLEEAKVWYSRAQTQGEEAIDKTITDMEKRIDKVKIMLKKRGKDVQHKLSELLIHASEIVKGKE
ncbi:MAG: hypothetical protein J7J07_02845 [Syntrophobacterales bacterium]|nr:hypothetical protein [Syntrophobacterales bacterium]